MPYQSDPVSRAKINAGRMDYLDVHLSHVAQMVWQGFFGHLDIALVEVAGITDDGDLIPSSSVGNNKTWIDQADRVILEVNSWQPIELEGMHDIYYGTALPPHRKPIQIVRPADRIGEPYLRCPPEKIVAVVPTHSPDRNAPFKPPDAVSRLIADHVLDFLSPRGHAWPAAGDAAAAAVWRRQHRECRAGRTGRRTVPAADRLHRGDPGRHAATVALGDVERRLGDRVLTQRGRHRANSRDDIDDYRHRIILRPQEISNHPEVIRRLGCLAMNGMIEADIYGNVNSTHLMGSSIQNGIGGSGDFARNAYISMFVTPSTAKGGVISCIVPMVSHVDHTEHDVHVIVTEQGLADLRGLPPRRRAPADHRPLRAPGLPAGTAGLPRPGHGHRRAASTPRTCSTRRCPGTCATCRTEP